MTQFVFATWSVYLDGSGATRRACELAWRMGLRHNYKRKQASRTDECKADLDLGRE